MLSDPQKRSVFDQTGGDPDARAAPAGGASPMGNPFAGGFPGGFRSAPSGSSGIFEAEISPEEIINMMFGGGMGPGTFFGQQGGFPFGGGPGIRVRQFGTGPGVRRRRPATPGGQQRGESGHAPAEDTQDGQTGVLKILIQLLPLIIFFLLPAIGSLFSGDSLQSRGPQFSMTSQSPYTFLRQTPNYHIPFYVNPLDFKDMSTRDSAHFEKRAETTIVNQLNHACTREEHERQQAIHDSEGWIFTDQEKRQRAQKMPMPNCRRMEELGVRRTRNY